MYIRKLRLKNVMCFEDAELTFVDACIKYLGLNREELLERRRHILSDLRFLHALYQDAAIPARQRREILRKMREMAVDKSEFAGMIRFYLRIWRMHP